nr:hypothetical protein [uncultured Sellimonas sp.]
MLNTDLKLFIKGEYNRYTAHFQLYSVCKEKRKCIKVLIPMLKSLTHKWDINRSPLYRYIKTKETEKGIGSKMQKSMIQLLQADEETAFLQDSPEFQSILDEINKEKRKE